ncbi:hypothetical protein [Halomonas alkaliantarctica]|uniref:hypothetical protein n=1 Tax=Halomonas alkaliantarctica TaxID=232346 RepID=UPI000ADD0772|nr:hypothetical protein [Halomonas alkaliantarctica]
MPRPKGAKNAKPSRREVASYYAMLRSAADAGDVKAAAELIRLSCSEQPENKRHGV